MKVESTVAKFIRRFREGEPLSRDRRQRNRGAMEGAFWWARSQEGDIYGSPQSRASRKNALEDRPNPARSEEGGPPPFLQPHRGEAREANRENAAQHSVRRPTLDQTCVLVAPPTPLNSPTGRPLCDVAHTQPSKGEPDALKLMYNTDDGERKGQADQPVSRIGVGAESFVPDERIGAYGGESDELAYLDARARTLLEDCRQLLAPSITISDQVLHWAPSAEGERGLDDYSHAPQGVEKRAWILLNNREELPASNNILPVRSSDRPRILEAQSDLLSLPDIAEVSMGEDGGEVQRFLLHKNVSGEPKHSIGWFYDEYLGEKENACRFQPKRGRQTANARNVDNVSVVPETETFSAHMDSLLHKHKDGVGNKCVCSLLSSELVCGGAQERTDWLREDPVLSALLHRFGEIETELKRRCSLQL